MSLLDKIKPTDAQPGTRISLPEEPRPLAPSRVTIVGMDIPFGDLVMLLVKIAIAAIPAAVILMVLTAFVAAGLGIFGAIFGQLGR